MSCGIGSPKQLFRVVTNAEGTLAPYRAPDPRGGRAPFRNTFIPASHQTGGWQAEDLTEGCRPWPGPTSSRALTPLHHASHGPLPLTGKDFLRVDPARRRR